MITSTIPFPYLNGVIPGADAYEVGLLTARGCNQIVFTVIVLFCLKEGLQHTLWKSNKWTDYISGFNAGNQSLNFFDDAFH